jgi:predicted signal transduction protein with EAL and GGDEF domain
MVGWVARVLLIVAGFVTSWFVAKDAPQFGVMQMALALILVVLVVFVLAFWPERWTHMLSRLHKPR